MIIIGVDETGYGAIAGPLVISAAAFRESEPPVTVTYQSKRGAKVLTAGDSKGFKYAAHREALDLAVRAYAVATATVMRTAKEIDTFHITKVFPETIRLAISRVIEAAIRQGESRNPADYKVLLDGDLKVPEDIPCEVRAIPGGDKTVWQIGAASIVSKVARDAAMEELHNTYPSWEFNQHKGYPVPSHKEKMLKYGLCPAHRRTYKPVIAMLPVRPGFER